MKTKTTLMIAMLAFTSIAFGQQQLTNHSFENWDTIGDYTQPSNWYSLNPLTQVGYDPSTTITSDAQDGQYAVMLESKSGSFNDYTGLLCTGPILDDQLNPNFTKMKVAFSDKPTAFTFYYKSLPIAGDSALIVMALTKWNTANLRTDTIAIATGMFGQTVATYTKAILPFEYTLNTTPDSMFIIATSSADGFNPTVGSIFIIDNMELSYSVGLAERNKLAVQVYPNPANECITIQGTSTETTYVMRDLYGKEVATGALSNPQISTTSIPEGVYVMELQLNGIQAVQKIVIQH
jgi:hypothetical protein